MKNIETRPMLLRASLFVMLSVLSSAGWAAVAGQFQFVSGDVRVVGDDGRERPARKGEDISEGETVVTGNVASAQLRMIDGGILALRPDSRLQMTTYTFKGREDGSEKASMSLLKGGLRAISGLIGKTNKQNYAINTPTATIGIRGTDHEPVVVLPPPPGQAPANPPGTYDKVNVGATTLTTLAGTTIINPNQVGFAGAPDALPVLLPRMPSFYQATPQPTQSRNQPARSDDSSSSEPAQQNADGSADGGPGTTTAASGDGAGEAMRVGGDADVASPSLASAGGNATGGANPAGAVNANGNAASASQGKLTGVDSGGNTLDATNQEVANSDGTVVKLEDYTAVIPNRPASWDHLPSVLTGTANYSMVGGTAPTDQAGATGTLRSAMLKVNFTTQLAAAEVGLTFGLDQWDLSSEGMVLRGRSFSSDRLDCSGACGLTVSKNGNLTYGTGQLGGSLTGSDLSGANLHYHFNEYGNYVLVALEETDGPSLPISGTVNLSGVSQPLDTPWRGVGISTGWRSGNQNSQSILDDYGHQVLSIADYRGYIDSSDGPVDLVKSSTDGKLTEFAGRAALRNAEHVSDALIKVGTAINSTGGTTTLGGVEVSWGRWTNGEIDIYSRDGSMLIGTIDNTDRSLHWLATGKLTGPITTLPVTGAATYTLAGHTLPTDMHGHTGTLASASLSANFTQMKVNAEVVVNMGIGSGMTTLSTAATGIPLHAGGGFSSVSGASTAASHTASCSGTACGNSPAQGFINGTFIGTGAAGAAMAYGIASGSTSSLLPSGGTAVTGVAVFKR